MHDHTCSDECAAAEEHMHAMELDADRQLAEAELTPPAGWFVFGTHVDRPGPLDFSDEVDEAGMPLWERPHQSAPVSIYTIYANPLDFPGKFVVRRHVVEAGHSVPDVMPMVVADNLEGAREVLPPGSWCLGREPGDDQKIVESWI